MADEPLPRLFTERMQPMTMTDSRVYDATDEIEDEVPQPLTDEEWRALGKEEVKRRLSQGDNARIRLPGGALRCTVCFQVFETPQGHGSHCFHHKVFAGVAPPKHREYKPSTSGAGLRVSALIRRGVKYLPAAQVARVLIHCPVEGCESEMILSSANKHLQTVHGFTTEQTHAASAKLRSWVRTSLADAAPDEEEPIIEPSREVERSPFSADEEPIEGMSSMDATVGMLLGLAPGDSLKITDLPDVMHFAAHVEHIRKMLNGER